MGCVETIKSAFAVFRQTNQTIPPSGGEQWYNRNRRWKGCAIAITRDVP